MIEMKTIEISASEYEGFGISVLEGMASGCVPILNDIPSFNEILNNCGFVIDFSEHEAAANKILEILKTDISKIRKSARKEVKKYDWEKIVKKWEKVYG